MVQEVPIYRMEPIDPERADLGMRKVDTGRKTLTVKLTNKSRRNEDSPDVKIIRFLLGHVATDMMLPNATVRHMGKCGCCGRALTVPESLDRGIGPECWSRICGA